MSTAAKTSPPAFVHPQQAESMARLAVSKEPDSPVAWRTLLEKVDMNGDRAELERLARMAVGRLPDDPYPRSVLVGAMAMNGRVRQAIQLLDGTLSQRGRGSTRELQMMIDLLARDQPGTALRLVPSLRRAIGADPLLDLREAGLRSRLAGQVEQPCVALFADADWHAWILGPIAQALADAGIGFVVVDRMGALVAARPQWVVLCGPLPATMMRLRTLLPRTRFVNTRHGVSVNGKNYGLYSAAACDHVCASSPLLAADIERQAVLEPGRVWATGYPQMDGLWRALARRGERREGKPCVMFAPTFNQTLSAAFLIGNDPVGALRGSRTDLRIVLAPHPHLRVHVPDMLARWQEIARTQPDVEYFDVAKANTIDRLADADLLVSDVSSVATQYVATLRPIVRLYGGQGGAAAADDEVDRRVAAVSRVVTDPSRLTQAVRASLTEPEPPDMLRERQALRDYLYGGMEDGRAGERVAREIASRIAQATSQPGTAR